MTLFSLLFLALAHPTKASSGCYYPNGVETSGDVPCNSSANVSFCCASGYICLSNQICEAGPDITGGWQFNRGSCTDSSWTSDECPKFCISAESNWNNGNALISCSGDVGEYCCNSPPNNDTCCDYSTDVFSLGAGTDITTIGSASTTSVSVSSTLTHLSVSASTTASTLATTSPLNTASSTNSSPIPTSSATGSSSKSSNKGVDIRVGAGVGAGGSLVLLGILAYIWRRKRRISKGTAAYEKQPESIEIGGPNYPATVELDSRDVAELPSISSR